jgi:hypothetical protein
LGAKIFDRHGRFNAGMLRQLFYLRLEVLQHCRR